MPEIRVEHDDAAGRRDRADRLSEEQVVSRLLWHAVRTVQEIRRAVFLREIVEHHEQLRHQPQVSGKRSQIAVDTAYVREVVRLIQHTAKRVENGRAAEERVEQLSTEPSLEKLQKAAAGDRQMMHGSVGAVADAVSDLNRTLRGVRRLEVGAQPGQQIGRDYPIEEYPAVAIETLRRIDRAAHRCESRQNGTSSL